MARQSSSVYDCALRSGVAGSAHPWIDRSSKLQPAVEGGVGPKDKYENDVDLFSHKSCPSSTEACSLRGAAFPYADFVGQSLDQ